MYCRKCGQEADADNIFCENCGAPLYAKSQTKELSDKPKTIKPKKKKSILAVFWGLGVLLAAAAAVVVLTVTGVIDWLGPPECEITENKIEATEVYNLLDYIKIKDDSDRDWDVSIEEDNIEIDKLGRYSVIYLAESDKKQYELTAEFEIVENILPKAEQIMSEFEFGEPINISDTFKITDLKDGEYDIDDSAFEQDKIGTFTIAVHVWNSRGFDETYEYEIIVKDTQAPLININCPSEVIQGEQIDFAAMVSASDNYDGDITDNVQIESDINLNEPGLYTVTFKAEDSSENVTEKSAQIQVCGLYGLGDKIQINNWNITIKDFYFSKKVNDKNTWSSVLYHIYTAGTGKTYMAISAAVENNAENSDCFANKPGNYSFADIEKTDELEYRLEEVSVIADCSGESRTLQPIEDMILGNDLRNYYYSIVNGSNKHSGKFYFYVNETLEDECDSFLLKIKSVKDTEEKDKVIYVVLK